MLCFYDKVNIYAYLLYLGLAYVVENILFKGLQRIFLNIQKKYFNQNKRRKPNAYY